MDHATAVENLDHLTEDSRQVFFEQASPALRARRADFRHRVQSDHAARTPVPDRDQRAATPRPRTGCCRACQRPAGQSPRLRSHQRPSEPRPKEESTRLESQGPWRSAASHPSGSIRGYITTPAATHGSRARADASAATAPPAVGSSLPSWSGGGDAHGEREDPSSGRDTASLRAATNATASDICSHLSTCASEGSPVSRGVAPPWRDGLAEVTESADASIVSTAIRNCRLSGASRAFSVFSFRS